MDTSDDSGAEADCILGTESITDDTHRSARNCQGISYSAGRGKGTNCAPKLAKMS